MGEAKRKPKPVYQSLAVLQGEITLQKTGVHIKCGDFEKIATHISPVAALALFQYPEPKERIIYFWVSPLGMNIRSIHLVRNFKAPETLKVGYLNIRGRIRQFGNKGAVNVIISDRAPLYLWITRGDNDLALKKGQEWRLYCRYIAGKWTVESGEQIKPNKKAVAEVGEAKGSDQQVVKVAEAEVVPVD